MFAKTSFFISYADSRFKIFAKRLLLCCGCGIVGIWGAVFADVGVALVAICNVLRALIVKNNKKNK